MEVSIGKSLEVLGCLMMSAVLYALALYKVAS